MAQLLPMNENYKIARFVGRETMAKRKRQPHSALVASSARSRDILNSIPTVIYELAITAKGFPTQWVSDSVNRILDSVKRILGYEVEEALAPNWWIDCLHPDDKEAAVENTSTLITQGHLVQEYRFRSKDGCRTRRASCGKPTAGPRKLSGSGPTLQNASRRKNGQRERASKSSRGASCCGLAIATLQ